MAKIPNLRQLRENAGLTRSAVAARAGLHRDTYSKAENEQSVRRDTLTKIRVALNALYYEQSKSPLPLEIIEGEV